MRRKYALLFGALLFYLYFRGIGDHALIDPVEGVNASVSIHMFAGGNYFMPRIGDALATGSTLGTWWLDALAIKIFGWGEFAIRFWSALAGIVMIFASALALGLSGRKSWLAASICAGMTLCFTVSQISSSHAIYSCLMALAMVGVIRWRENKRWLILSHAAISLAFIAHGLEGLIIPFLAVCIYCFLCEDRKLFMNFFTWPAGILITVIFSGLYFAALMIFNPAIIQFMLCEKYSYDLGGVMGIIIFMFAGFIPFHGFILRAVWEVFPKKFPAQKSKELFMLVWAFVFMFAALAARDVLALAACVPAFSALLGSRVDTWLEQKNLHSIKWAFILSLFILVPVLYVVLPFTVNYFPVIRAAMMSLIPWEILTGLFLFALWHYTKTKQITKWARNVPAAALLCLMPLAGVFNLTAEKYSLQDIGVNLRDNIKGTDKVIQYSVNYPSVYFYTLRNSSIIDAQLTNGVQEKNFAANYTLINSVWEGSERVFLIMPEDVHPSEPLPQQMNHIDESGGILLLSNQ